MADETALPMPESRLARKLANDEVVGKDPARRFTGKGFKRAAARREAILAFSVQGYTQKEIGEILGMTHSAVRNVLYEMRKRGAANDSELKLDHRIVPAAVEQMEAMIAAGDKDAIFTVLKGRGLLKQHTAGPVPSGPTMLTQLVVKFEMPPGTTEKPVLQGQVVGVAREAER